MKEYHGTLLGIAFILLTAAFAQAMDCPQEISSDFPLCKKSAVLQTAKISGATIVSLQTKAPMESVFKDYKNAAQKSGWHIVMETNQNDAIILVGQKGERQLALNVSKNDDNTLIQISISK